MGMGNQRITNLPPENHDQSNEIFFGGPSSKGQSC